MKRKFSFIIVILSIALNISAKKYIVFYLGGQSNMVGLGTVSELPKELNQPVNGVYIFHGSSTKDTFEVGGQGIWEVLKPGHGANHSATFEKNNLSGKFGIELTFGIEMQKLYPDYNIALIKYSRGGTSLHKDAAGTFGCWEPDFTVGTGINQYDHFLATVRNAYAVRDIDGDGEDDELIPAGILWMQGESDAGKPEWASQYAANLKRMIDLIRAAFRTDDLPVVVGRISDSGNSPTGKVWKYGREIRWQQARFVSRDGNAALVTSTDNYNYSDPWHYDTEGYIDFGKQFARKMVELLER